ncbi:MAG: HEAT repeat domain-containing protein [Gallionellaceae bacterium]
MKGAQQICLACFHLIPVEAPTCPQCGADIAAFSARDYREKLLHALFHPLADVRMRAVIALGWRDEPETADALVACALRHPSDVVEGLEIINSLVQMKDVVARQTALSTLKAHHPAHAVREAAARMLDESASQREADA